MEDSDPVIIPYNVIHRRFIALYGIITGLLSLKISRTRYVNQQDRSYFNVCTYFRLLVLYPAAQITVPLESAWIQATSGGIHFRKVRCGLRLMTFCPSDPRGQIWLGLRLLKSAQIFESPADLSNFLQVILTRDRVYLSPPEYSGGIGQIHYKESLPEFVGLSKNLCGLRRAWRRTYFIPPIQICSKESAWVRLSPYGSGGQNFVPPEVNMG